MPDIPVFEVKQENANFKPRLLHRNILLPFNGLPAIEESDSESDRERPKRKEPEPESSSSGSSSDSDKESDDSEQREIELTTPETQRYVIPARRSSQSRYNNAPKETSNSRQNRSNSPQQKPDKRQRQNVAKTDQEQPRRGARQRKKPEWMQNEAWQFPIQPYVFEVPANRVTYI